MPDKKCSTCTHLTVCGHWRDYLNASRSDTRLLCGHLLPEWRGDEAEVVQALRWMIRVNVQTSRHAEMCAIAGVDEMTREPPRQSGEE